MSSLETQYLVLAQRILGHGEDREDRTGVGTRGIFGAQIRGDLSLGFPLLTTKKMFVKGIIHELLWFLAGRTDNQYLVDRDVTIWNEWATPEQCEKYGREPGDLGPVYGKQWRNFGAKVTNIDGAKMTTDGFDQIKWLVNEIQKNPNSRRLIVSAWDARDAQRVALPPCHTLFQCYVQSGKLSLHLYMRSADLFLGVPFNIASYAFLTHLLAKVTDLDVGELIISFGDVHIYRNHFQQVKEQLQRSPKASPIVSVNDTLRGAGMEGIESARFEDFMIFNYDPHPAIKGEVAV